MTPEDVYQLTLVALAAVLAPLLVTTVRRFAIPSVVLEITFGIILGPQVLDLIQPTGLVDGLSTLGLSMLMFLAGYELKLDTIRGRPLTLASISWGMSVALAAIVGVVVHFVAGGHGEIVIPLALTTTALGTLLPVLRDAGVLRSPLGRYAMALGSIGEFGPIVLVALLLTGADTAQSVLVLAIFGLFVLGAARLANRPWGERVVSFIGKGLQSSSQLPIRLTLLFMLVLAAMANRLGIDVLLGAFAAGVVVRIPAAKYDDEEDESDASSIFGFKLEGIGFGMLVPIFFVVSGTRIDLGSLFANPTTLLAVPGFLLLMLVVRAIPTFLCYRKALGRTQRRALAVMSATGLPLIVVITTIAVDNGYISSADAAAMVAAGMLSVVILPAVSIALLGRVREARPIEPGAGL
ncbi:MAG TPA: cation:proton antiporter [Lapillicoccus sp.]|jgi:Kef-type K+ transport system membrane component KefB|nr:cation:proton antiporter [Lapillicoccus sp.]